MENVLENATGTSAFPESEGKDGGHDAAQHRKILRFTGNSDHLPPVVTSKLRLEVFDHASLWPLRRAPSISRRFARRGLSSAAVGADLSGADLVRERYCWLKTVGF